MFKFENPLPIVYGLAFDVVKCDDMASGYQPADIDLGARLQLFGDVRLNGFASMLNLDFATELVIVGGIEGRYKGENIARGYAIMQMLVKDYGIRSDRVKFLVSDSNTGGNVRLILNHAKGSSPVVTTNHYHCPRTTRLFREADAWADTISVEAFWLLEDFTRKSSLVERFGNVSLAERDAEEIQGVAQLLQKTYKARTSTITPPS